MAVALFIGVGLRIWEFGKLPPGLEQDEVSIAVEANSLYYYGIDRNGISYPVHFIAWGSGQNALYGYLLMPLVPFGLTTFTIRLPMLISGILTLPIVFGIARKIFSPRIALLSIFLMAISPWHISMSRWALESNLFPFMFSLSFLCLMHIDRRAFWFPVAMVLFGLSMYAYGTAYFIIPLFLLAGSVFIFWKKILSRKMLAFGLGVYLVVALPIFLFILINAFQLPEIQIGAVTIPRVISDPRIIEMTGFLSGGKRWYYYDLLTTAKILFLHTDGIPCNFIPPFGYLFPGAVLFSLLGAGLAAEKFVKQKLFGDWAFGVWLALAFLLGMTIPPAVHRINIIFIPLILCAALAMDWILRDKRILLIPATAGLIAYAVLFWREYRSPEYQNSVGWEFNAGMIPALQSINKYPDVPVCITNEMNFPYVYVQLVDRRNPNDFLATIQYLDPIAKYRVVEKMGRYSFGIHNCSLNTETIYILKIDQTLPMDSSLFNAETFDFFVVYIPKAFD
ncbi:MAG: glycosyltransferase family 39 protein [Anaerolineales bacterium]|nr:glycosyltransferase family 39 protein [Anaerolineales bacterium]